MYFPEYVYLQQLTHSGRVTHKYVGKLTIIGSDNGFSLRHCQAIIWKNAGLLLIVPLGTHLNLNLNLKTSVKFNRNTNIYIEENAFENVICEMSISSRPQCVNFWRRFAFVIFYLIK